MLCQVFSNNLHGALGTAFNLEYYLWVTLKRLKYFCYWLIKQSSSWLAPLIFVSLATNSTQKNISMWEETFSESLIISGGLSNFPVYNGNHILYYWRHRYQETPRIGVYINGQFWANKDTSGLNVQWNNICESSRQLNYSALLFFYKEFKLDSKSERCETWDEYSMRISMLQFYLSLVVCWPRKHRWLNAIH